MLLHKMAQLWRYLSEWGECYAMMALTILALSHTPGCSTDFTWFFLPSTVMAAQGKWALVYAIAYKGSMNVTPPIGLLAFLLPALSNSMGTSVCAGMPVIGAALVSMSLEAVGLLWLWTMLLAKLQPHWSRTRLLLWLGFSAPGLMTMLTYGHAELLLAAILVTAALLALQRSSWNLALLLLCVAPFAKTSELPVSLALLAWLLFQGRLQAGWKGLVGGILLNALAIAPFLLANARATVTALVVFHATWGVHGFSLWRLVPLLPGGEIAITIGGAIAMGWFGARQQWPPVLVAFVVETLTMIGLKEWYPYYPLIWMAWGAVLWPVLALSPSQKRWLMGSVFLGVYGLVALFMIIGATGNSALGILGSVLMMGIIGGSGILTVVVRKPLIEKQPALRVVGESSLYHRET